MGKNATQSAAVRRRHDRDDGGSHHGFGFGFVVLMRSRFGHNVCQRLMVSHFMMSYFMGNFLSSFVVRFVMRLMVHLCLEFCFEFVLVGMFRVVLKFVVLLAQS